MLKILTGLTSILLAPVMLTVLATRRMLHGRSKGRVSSGTTAHPATRDKRKNEAINKYRHFLEVGDVKTSTLWLHIGSAIDDLEVVSSASLKH